MLNSYREIGDEVVYDDLLSSDHSYESSSSLSTPLPVTNIGYKLLLKCGWNKAKGCGRLENGRLEPISFDHLMSGVGIGKEKEYDKMSELATSERKSLTIEIEVKESEQERAKRQEVEQKNHKKTVEIVSSLSVFLCQDCNKQYSNAMEFDNHLQSYDHHHTKRIKELKKLHPALQQKTQNDDLNKQDKNEIKRLKEQRAAALASAASITSLINPSLTNNLIKASFNNPIMAETSKDIQPTSISTSSFTSNSNSPISFPSRINNRDKTAEVLVGSNVRPKIAISFGAKKR